MAPILTRLGQSFGFGAPSGGGGASGPAPGINASGGIIAEYEDGGKYYRSHTFTASGSLVISSLSPNPSCLLYTSPSPRDRG